MIDQFETGWQFTLECPHCAAVTFRTVAPSVRRTRLFNRYSARVVACTGCAAEFVLTVELSDARNTPWPRQRTVPKPECGTDRGYHAHRRAGAEACQPCKDAHTATTRASKKRTRLPVKGTV